MRKIPGKATSLEEGNAPASQTGASAGGRGRPGNGLRDPPVVLLPDSEPFQGFDSAMNATSGPSWSSTPSASRQETTESPFLA